VAACRHPGRVYQAILRRFPTMINLSAVLSPGVGAARDPGAPDWAGLDRQWQSAAGPWSGRLLGAAYLYLGKIEALTADPGLAETLAAEMPVTGTGGWWHDGVLTEDGFALWELDRRGSDGRAERRFLILTRPEREGQLSDWTWSNGEPGLPPLGRHLWLAAAVRHQVRVWEEADDMRAVQQRLDHAGRDDLPQIRADLAFWRASLREMRHHLKTIEADLRRGSGPWEEDLELVVWLRRGLKNDLATLAIADDRARTLADLPSVPDATTPGRRDVFVIHGRDDQARRALVSFLQAIDLHPLDWDEVVQQTGRPSPHVGEVLEQAFRRNQAAVVLMTPDDGAYLHESLREQSDPAFEGSAAGQVRPTVLLRAGMALGRQRDRTVVIEIGALRPVSDLAGLDTVRFDGTVRSLQRIAQRLRGAGCAVNTDGTDWLDLSRFESLAAYARRF
jgi:predicted nucleotide-binding protein